VRREAGISVADDSFGQSEPSVQVIEIEFGDLRARYCSRARKEYCASGTAVVYDGKDSVIAFAIGESGDEVHRDVGEWFCFGV